MALVDVHCHLDAPAYQDLAAVCQQSQQAGVHAIVAAGTGLASNARILAMQQRYQPAEAVRRGQARHRSNGSCGA